MIPVFGEDSLIYPSISRTFDPYKFYIARSLTIVSDRLDDIDGIVIIVATPPTDMPEKILVGDIVYSQSIAAIMRLHKNREL